MTNLSILTPADIGSSYQDEPQKLIQALFHLARQRQPSIIVFDEIESTFTKRQENGNQQYKNSEIGRASCRERV